MHLINLLIQSLQITVEKNVYTYYVLFIDTYIIWQDFNLGVPSKPFSMNRLQTSLGEYTASLWMAPYQQQYELRRQMSFLKQTQSRRAVVQRKLEAGKSCSSSAQAYVFCSELLPGSLTFSAKTTV